MFFCVPSELLCKFWMERWKAELLGSNPGCKKISGLQEINPEQQPTSRVAADAHHQPFTLILEKESTAVPERGRPIQVAGRNVVKINMFFTCRGRSFSLSGSDRIR